jgi:serine O-acetyltransferase
MIGAGAKILGNIEAGEGSKLAAGSVVLAPVPPHTTAAGVPAKPVGNPLAAVPAFDMKRNLE